MTGTLKTILITGGTSGLGFALVKHFLSKGYEVYTVGRDLKNISLNNKNFHFIKCDLANLGSVSETISQLCEQVNNIDLVINNAGVLGSPQFNTTQDGFEYTFQVNFLSHLLIDELIVRARNSANPLIIVSVTSPVYKWVRVNYKFPEQSTYHSFRVYSESKVYIQYIGGYLTNKYSDKNIRYFILNPGIFRSGISRMKKKWFQRMYIVGAPFMRKPERIARSLNSILEDNKFINGKIYRGKNNSKELRNSDQQRIKEFMISCYAKIEKYLS